MDVPEPAEWEDDPDAIKIFLIFYIPVMIVLAGAQTILSQMGDSGGNIAQIFFNLGIFAGVIAGLSMFTQLADKYIGFGGFGSSKRAVLGIVVACLFGLIIIAKANLAIATFSIAQKSLEVFFVVIAAGIMEEFFFRGAMFWTFFKIAGEGWKGFLISAAITSVAFMIFHFFSYGADTGKMVAAMVFSIIAITGNRLFGSIGFSVALHIVNNGLMVSA